MIKDLFIEITTKEYQKNIQKKNQRGKKDKNSD